MAANDDQPATATTAGMTGQGSGSAEASSGTGAGEPSRRVLLVEDERHIRDLVELHLGLEGFTTTPIGNGEEALALLREQAFDLVVLDLMLPGLDGLTILKVLRREPLNADVPVLLLTARREETDKVLGLETGADDYLTKPFGVRELIARVRALMRRPRPSRDRDGDPSPPPSPRKRGEGVDTNAPEMGEGRVKGLEPGTVRLREVIVDPARRRVTVDGQDVELTAREFDLLFLLASHPGIVFSREALLARVWKGEAFVGERGVDTLIKRIRRKIEKDPANPALVLTVWGSGYKAADA
jgi:two-component system, OmpR family, alkaline phosphatase synthesis response regulator PhoP